MGKIFRRVDKNVMAISATLIALVFLIYFYVVGADFIRLAQEASEDYFDIVIVMMLLAVSSFVVATIIVSENRLLKLNLFDGLVIVFLIIISMYMVYSFMNNGDGGLIDLAVMVARLLVVRVAMYTQIFILLLALIELIEVDENEYIPIFARGNKWKENIEDQIDEYEKEKESKSINDLYDKISDLLEEKEKQQVLYDKMLNILEDKEKKQRKKQQNRTSSKKP